MRGLLKTVRSNAAVKCTLLWLTLRFVLATDNCLLQAQCYVVTNADVFAEHDTAPVASTCSQNTDDIFIFTVSLKMKGCTDKSTQRNPLLKSFLIWEKKAKLCNCCCFPLSETLPLI